MRRLQHQATVAFSCMAEHYNTMLQVEKYRPVYFRDNVGNKDAVERLQVISEEGNMPNIILSVCLSPTSPQ